jgi:hypothetical protein
VRTPEELHAYFESLRDMTPLERARAEHRRLGDILQWLGGQLDEERCRRIQLEAELERTRAQVARTQLVVGSKLSWLVGFLGEACAKWPQFEHGLARLEETRRELRDGLDALDEPHQVEDAA